MQVKIQRMYHLSGCDRITMFDGDDDQTVDFIRATVVEQHEADLLKQLEVSEETVAVLEQLLQKYAGEVKRLREYNQVLREMQKPVVISGRLPPVNPGAPLSWPVTNKLPEGWFDMREILAALAIVKGK